MFMIPVTHKINIKIKNRISLIPDSLKYQIKTTQNEI